MAGLSNICYQVCAPGKVSILYRSFTNAIANKEVEAVVFKVCSEQNIGPKLLHQGTDFRLEEFFEGRPISIWEMRNPIIMNAFLEKIFRYNWNEQLRTEVKKVSPVDINYFYCEIALKEWGPEVKEKFPSWRGKLLQDNGIPHPKLLKIIDATERVFMFKGYQEYY